MDPRYPKLAEVLIGFSTEIEAGEHVLVDSFDAPEAMTIALIRAIRARGAFAHIRSHHARLTREILRDLSEEEANVSGELALAQIQKMDAYVGIRSGQNIFESSDVPAEHMQRYTQSHKTAQDYRVRDTKWVVLRWPSPAMAQQARMSTEAFEDFYFTVCTQDFRRFEPGMEALKARLEATKDVRITGPGTDLSFSIEGIAAVPCGGKRNIPDGEVFTAPVRDSVNGTLAYNVACVYQGVSFDGVKLRFENGKIVEATASQNEKRLNEILDTDEGARYIGEFAIGFNPHILEPMQDTLFDEKIAGSFHFTPGQCYRGVADNGNDSRIHWDMVCIQRPDYGGGKMFFDGELVREDGIFIVDDLKALNPDQLLG